MSGLDFVSMFEGLDSQQSKELTTRLRAAVEIESKNFKKGVQPMNQEFLDNLSEEERARLNQGIEQLANDIAARRQAAALSPLIEQYRRDMLAAPRGSAGRGQREAIKATARAAGVPVDSIDFTGGM